MALSRIFVAPKNGQGGVKNQNFFSEKIFERWIKKILGPLGPYLQKIDGRSGMVRGGVRPTVTSPGNGLNSHFRWGYTLTFHGPRNHMRAVRGTSSLCVDLGATWWLGEGVIYFWST